MRALAGRTPSRRFDFVSAATCASFGPCFLRSRHLGALAMKIGETSGLAFLGVLLGALAFASSAAEYVETPWFVEAVAAGVLPPVAERLPERPSVVDLGEDGRAIGRHGGELRMLSGREKDVRMLVVYGYARLVAYDRSFALIPDLLESYEVDKGRVFTLRLRPGLRWSDGHLVSAEDFRYFWEDIAGNETLAPFGPARALRVKGLPARFEVLDEYTVRYSWDEPNPFFLPALAGARPEPILAPAHYLRRFHARYTDEAELAALAKAEGRRNWGAVHINRFRPYKNTNPELPTLQPWVNTTRAPSQRYVFERNPFYHRVDGEGRQLPYIDRVVFNIADGKLIPAKAGAGETDLQARHLAFGDYPYLKQGEERSGYRVRLWDTTKGAHIALFPNLNVEDETWRALVRDARFRRALSLGIDREEINYVIYYGLAREGNDSVLPGSALYRPEYRERWAAYDLAAAGALLDELGLKARDSDGTRLLPDGRRMEIIVETAGEDTEQSDVLELVQSTWAELGIRTFTKPLQREVLRNRIFSGKTLMSVWSGMENGVPNAGMSPHELAPTSQVQLQWPKWGQYVESGGEVGEAVDLPEARALAALNEEWKTGPPALRREAIWHEMLAIRAEQVFTLGIVAGVPQPVVISRRLRNVPEKGAYNWEPGAYFGIYRPDTFWFDD